MISIDELIKGLSLESLRSLKKSIGQKISSLEEEQHDLEIEKRKKQLNKLIFHEMVEERKRNKKTTNLETVFGNACDRIPVNEFWFEYTVKTTSREIPCCEDECWYKGNLDRFDGTLVCYSHLFTDKVLCDVCYENFGEKELGEFEEEFLGGNKISKKFYRYVSHSHPRQKKWLSEEIACMKKEKDEEA